MSLTLLTPPAAPALSVPELADHLQLASGFCETDPLWPRLYRAIASATSAIEHHYDLALITQSWRWRIDAEHIQRVGKPLAPPRHPIQQIDAVQFERAGGTTSLDPASLTLTARKELIPADLPLTGTLQVDFTAGFGPDWNHLPADLSEALRQLAAHLLDPAEPADKSTSALNAFPAQVAALLAPYRRLRL
ncbi:MAG: hypothetical protein MRY63_06510 [Neomegalonema sp.]|nr:hypothetical protein [Neomegalonema sp.]